MASSHSFLFALRDKIADGSKQSLACARQLGVSTWPFTLFDSIRSLDNPGDGKKPTRQLASS